MSPDDAAKVAKIMLTADGWCGTCSGVLLDQLATAYPEHAAVIRAIEARRDAIKDAHDAAYDVWVDDQRTAEPQVWQFS